MQTNVTRYSTSAIGYNIILLISYSPIIYKTFNPDNEQ